MCGIAGYAGFHAPGLLNRMCDAIVHRGPDGAGQAEFPPAGLAIGMRRLAIIDLEHGDQPFVNDEGTVHLVYNGEIYNHVAMRDELRERGRSFRTRCDTEVVLQAFLEWGDEAWSRLHGMFAAAIVDLRGEQPRLLVVRDRVGIKPLYYLEQDGALVFASEIKALLAWSKLSPSVDLAALRDYLALRYVPGPRSLLAGVRKLPAGHVLTFAGGRVEIARWWRPPAADLVEPDMDAGDAAATIGAAMRIAVRRHLVSDVPVGAFLSGGIDSNVIVALMAEVSTAPVHTFSIGFPDFPDEDRRLAAITAKALGTDHNPIECGAADMASLPEIAWALDEPVGDAIVVPMYVLAREARRDVKVVLSGEGADEILGGYMFHRKLVQIQRLRRRLPGITWRVAAAVAARMPAPLLNRLFDYPGSLGREGRRHVVGFLRSIERSDPVALYRRSVSLFGSDDILEASACDALTRAAHVPAAAGLQEPFEGTPLQVLVHAQFHDWLPDDILMKADKMTMAHSLEGRVPFMDEEVIRAAARLPDRHKLAAGANKKALRDFAADLLPPELVKSPKMAFYIPLESYIRTPVMRDLIGHALDDARVRRRGLFRPEWVRAMVDAPASAGFLPLKRMFAILMLELWFDRFCPDASWA